MRKWFAAIGLAGCIVALASCSQPYDDSVAHQETTGHGTVAVDGHEIKSHFKVIDEKGQAVELNLEDGPVLFVAHWCPNCNDYLQFHEPIPGVRVVAVYPMKGETAEEMMAGVRRKLDEAGWENVPLYGTMELDIVDGVPVIAYKSREDVFFRNPFEIGEGERR